MQPFSIPSEVLSFFYNSHKLLPDLDFLQLLHKTLYTDKEHFFQNIIALKKNKQSLPKNMKYLEPSKEHEQVHAFSVRFFRGFFDNFYYR